MHYLYVGTDFIEFYQLFGINVKFSVIGNLISWYLTGLTPVSTDESYISKAKDLPDPGSYAIIRHGKRQWYPGLIISVAPEATDVEVKFMYPSGKGKINLSLVLLIQCGVLHKT